MSPAPQRKPALGPEADGELILAVPQGEGLIRDRHGKQQLLCCTFLQQHPRDNKKKPKKNKKTTSVGSDAAGCPVGLFLPQKFNRKTAESLDAQTLMLLRFLGLTFTDTISIFYMTANFQLLSHTPSTCHINHHQ